MWRSQERRNRTKFVYNFGRSTVTKFDIGPNHWFSINAWSIHPLHDLIIYLVLTVELEFLELPNNQGEDFCACEQFVLTHGTTEASQSWWIDLDCQCCCEEIHSLQGDTLPLMFSSTLALIEHRVKTKLNMSGACGPLGPSAFFLYIKLECLYYCTKKIKKMITLFLSMELKRFGLSNSSCRSTNTESVASAQRLAATKKQQWLNSRQRDCCSFGCHTMKRIKTGKSCIKNWCLQESESWSNIFDHWFLVSHQSDVEPASGFFLVLMCKSNPACRSCILCELTCE